MFHPSKRRYKGGNYTDASLLSTNLYKYTDENSVIKGIINSADIIPYVAVLNQSKDEADLTSAYHSTLSTISASVAALEADFTEKTTLANNSYTLKSAAYENYINTEKIYDNYKAAYLTSTIYYSSLVYELSTLTGEDSAMLARYYNLSTFGNLDAMSTFLGHVGISTFRGLQIQGVLGQIHNYNTSVIPSSISSLDGYSSIFLTDRRAYLEEEDRISTLNIPINANNDKIKTFIEQKESYDARILANTQQYTIKKGLLQIDNNTQKYLSSYGAVVSTYMMYSSTFNMMHEIENLYNMVINGAPLSSDFIDAIGIQQGGYIPMYEVTPLVCDQNDTTCKTNRDFLSKYLTVYFSLSTVLPKYKDAYEKSNEIYRTALGSATTTINSDIINILSDYDEKLKIALDTVHTRNPIYTDRKIKREELNTIYTTPRIQISTSAFTLSEREQLLTGIQSGGELPVELPVENIATGTITIPKSNYSDATITGIHTSSISTYQGIQKINNREYTIVNNNYMSTLAAYQMVDIKNEAIRSIKGGVDNQTISVRAIIKANKDTISSLTYQSTILGNTSITYNTNIVENTAGIIAKSLSQINTVLNVFQQSTIRMCAAMNNQLQNEVKVYLATICQISTLVLFDSATKHLNNVRGTGNLPGGIEPTQDPEIRMLYNFLDESHKYVNMLLSEELIKSEYVKTKLQHDLESSNRLSRTDPAQIMNSGEFALLTLRYDAYAQQLNDAIKHRSSFNKHYITQFDSIKNTLEGSTLLRIVDKVSYSLGNGQEQHISSLFPYDMSFNYIQHKSNLFSLNKVLPTNKILTCEPLMIDDGTPRTTTTIDIPTTTVGREYGVPCQYIHITRADNNIEIMQIIAVDRYGKNHVLNANITLFPSSFTGNTSHIKNGIYSVTQTTNNPLRPVNLNNYLLSSSNLSEPKVIRINLGKMVDITGITYVKRNASYSSAGITISLYDNEYNPVTVPQRYYNYTPNDNILAGANWSEIKTPGSAKIFTQQTSSVFRSTDINEAKKKCVLMEDCLGIQFESSTQKWLTGKGAINSANGSTDYVYSLSYNSQMLGQQLPSNTMQILSDFPSKTFDLRLSTADLTSKVIVNPTRYGVCGIMGRYIMLSVNNSANWLPPPNSGGKFFTSDTSVPFSASTGMPAENQAAAKAACISMADCLGIQNVGGNNTWKTGKGTLLTDQNTNDYVLIPPYYYYSLSQITVVSPDGTNLAIGASIHTTMPTSNPVSILINGKYNSLPASQSFVCSTATKNDYIIIDLGVEKEISAVNLYYATDDSPTNQNSAAVTIFTEDNMAATIRDTSKYHTTIFKEVIDFTFEGAPKCYTSVKWPSYYGAAGIIARYIRIERSGPLAFSKLEVIDKTGVDVAQFKLAFASSNQNLAIIPVSSMNPSSARPIAKSYASENNGNQYYYVDLGVEKEICAINVYNCTDVEYLARATILIYNNNNSKLTEFRMENSKQIHRFDTRYEPSTSQLPTTVKKSLTRYGSYGIYTEEVHVYSITTASVTIVDAAGLSVPRTLSTSSYTSNGINLTIYKYRLPRLYEITSVIVNNPNVNQIVQLYDCYNILVGQARASTVTPTNTVQMGYYADFRNLWNGYPNMFAPVVPYNSKGGGYDLAYFNHITNRTASYTPTINYSNSGVKARYIKIIPRDNITPLHISQILVVDEFGINRAYNAQTYYQSTVPTGAATQPTAASPAAPAAPPTAPSNSYFPPSAKNMVDGVYEAEIDSPEFLTLFFQKYRRKQNNLTESYISATPAITPSATSFTPSPFTLIDIGLDTTTPLNARLDPTYGKEYSINSVIYVTSQGKGKEAVGVIIQLLDDLGNVVGSQMVTRMADIFGVDILDFRADPTVSIETLPRMVEVRPRMIEVGTCGVMTQYIRIEQTDPMKPIQISQVIVTDTNGNNVAAFKPTFASYNQSMSYSLVDGKYYTKLLTDAYSSSDTTLTTPLYNQFIEINLEKEYELTSIQVADIFGGSSGFNTLRARTLNASRDVIASQSVHVPQAIRTTLGATGTGTGSLAYAPLDTSNFLYLSKIGVQIANNLISYKYQDGSVVAAAITTYSTMTTLPTLLPELNTCPSGSQIYRPSIPYTRINGGIPSQYVRVYNVNNYIQISQLMAYDSSGVNWAYKKTCRATSTIPHCYADYAVDGKGGFFHQARPEPECFISGNNRYDFWEVDLGALYNIIAVRYIPPSTKSIRNIGTRVQLLDQNRVVLSQLVVQESGDVILDFRDKIPIQITQVIMPSITTLYSAAISFGGISAYILNSVDTISFVNLNSQTTSNINTNTLALTQNLSGYGASTPFYTNAISVFYDTTTSKLLTLDYAGNTVCSVSNSIRYIHFNRDKINKPYYMNKNNGVYYISENKINGKLYSFTILEFNSPLTTICTMDNMSCFDFDSAGNIYICCLNNVLKLIPGGGTTIFAAESGATYNLPLKSPSGIAIDKLNNVFYISDIETNIVYALQNNKYTIVAGTGEAGYTGNNIQGPLTRLNGPYFLQFINGILYISDKYNGIRMINFQSSTSKPISSTSTNVPQFTTTTIEYGTPYVPGTSVSETRNTYIVPVKTNDTYIRFTTPDTVSDVEIRQDGTSLLAPISGMITACIFSSYSNKFIICVKHNLITNTIMVYNESNDILYLQKTYNIMGYGDIKSITAYSSEIIYFTSSTHNSICRLNISNTGSTPTFYTGMINNYNYTPDGTEITSVSIKPEAVYFNSFDNTLYFTDIRTVGLVRKVNLSNRIQTVVGLNRSDTPTINTLEYYSFISDFIKPITNPLAITLINPCAMVNDIYGNLYIADSATFSIHRLTPYGALEPVCGPFRLPPSNQGYNIGTSTNANINTGAIGFVSQVVRDDVYPYAYSVKINSPTSLTFDSNMDLICTSCDGCQIIKISNLEGFEPSVEIISGVGADINNISNYSSKNYIGRYADLQYPNCITYLHKRDSFYFANKSGTNSSVLRRLKNKINNVKFKSNNGVLPYGLVNKISNTAVTFEYIALDSYDLTYYANNTGVYYYNNFGNTSRKLSLNTLTNPKGICLYNKIYLYYINTTENKLEYMDISLMPTVQNHIPPTTVLPLAIPDNTLSTATYLTVHENGCMWVAYPGSIKMLYLKAPTLVLNTISIGPQTLTKYGPIFVDSTNNCLYISLGRDNGQISTVKKYELLFEYSPIINTNINISFTPSNITAITCDADGNLFYSDGSNIYQVIQRIAESKSAISQDDISAINENRNTGNSNITHMVYCSRVTRGLTGIYLVANNTVRFMNITGGVTTPNLLNLKSPTNQPYAFTNISSVYYDGTNIYVADRGANNISVFDSETYAHIKNYSTSSVSSPTALVVNQGIIYFATNSNNSIYSINTTAATPVITVFCSIVGVMGVINKLIINSDIIYAMDSRRIYKITFSKVITVIYSETSTLNTFSVFNTRYYFSKNTTLQSFNVISTCSYNEKYTWLINKYNNTSFTNVNIVSISSNNGFTYCAANCRYENVDYSYVFILSQDGTIYNVACGSPLTSNPSSLSSTFPSPVLRTQISYPIRAITFTKYGNLVYTDNNSMYRIDSNQVLYKNRIYTVAGYSLLAAVTGSSESVATGDYGLGSHATFTSPVATTYDSNDNMYVADSNKVRRIDARTGVITTVVTMTNAVLNQNNIVDIQFDKKNSLYILTSKAVYRCTSTSNPNQYSAPVLIAGGGTGYRDDVQAVSVSFSNCRTMRFDSIGNLYVVDSAPITSILNGNVLDSASNLDSFKNILETKAETLYGKKELLPSDMVPPYNMIGLNYNGLAQEDYYLQFELFGSSNGTITGTIGTPSNPYPGSACKNLNDVNTRIRTCRDRLDVYSSAFDKINYDVSLLREIDGAFVGQPTYYTMIERKNLPADTQTGWAYTGRWQEADYPVDAQSRLLGTNPKGPIVSYSRNATIVDQNMRRLYQVALKQIITDNTFDKTLVDTITAYNSMFEIVSLQFHRAEYGMVDRNGVHITWTMQGEVYHRLNWGYNTRVRRTTETWPFTEYNNPHIGDYTDYAKYLLNSGLDVKTYLDTKPGETALNAAYTEYYGVPYITDSPTSTSAVKRFRDTCMRRYGGDDLPWNYEPVSGVLFNYNRALTEYQTAKSNLDAALLTNAQSQAASYIRKIELNGIISTYASGSGMIECVGIAFDSNDNLYAVDHYEGKIYVINSATKQYALNMRENFMNFYNFGCALAIGISKPFGIAIHLNGDVYISCNNSAISYTDTYYHGGNLILKCNSSLQNLTALTSGSTTSIVAPPTSTTNFHGNTLLPAVKNPGLLSIDKNNRLLFVQDGFYSAYILPLDDVKEYVTVLSIRIEPSVRGRGICIGELTIQGDQNLRPNFTNATITNSLGSVFIPLNGEGYLNYTSSPQETNPFLLIKLNSPIQINRIVLGQGQVALNNNSVGMNILLYDVAGKLISSRKTTNLILNGACILNYDSTNESYS